MIPAVAGDTHGLFAPTNETALTGKKKKVLTELAKKNVSDKIVL